MSLEIIEINTESSTVFTRVSGAFKLKDVSAYFPTLMNSIASNAGYTENVDFCEIDNFEFGHDEFKTTAEQARSVYETGRITKVVFNVCNITQFGMARMFSTMAVDEGVEVVINKQDNGMFS